MIILPRLSLIESEQVGSLTLPGRHYYGLKECGPLQGRRNCWRHRQSHVVYDLTMNEPLKLNTQCSNISLDFGVQLEVSGTEWFNPDSVPRGSTGRLHDLKRNCSKHGESPAGGSQRRALITNPASHRLLH